MRRLLKHHRESSTAIIAWFEGYGSKDLYTDFKHLICRVYCEDARIDYHCCLEEKNSSFIRIDSFWFLIFDFRTTQTAQYECNWRFPLSFLFVFHNGIDIEYAYAFNMRAAVAMHCCEPAHRKNHFQSSIICHTYHIVHACVTRSRKYLFEFNFDGRKMLLGIFRSARCFIHMRRWEK